MIRKGFAFGIGMGVAWLLTVAIYAAASYPSSVVSFPVRSDGQTITAAWFNVIHDEVTAIAGGLINGLNHDLKFVDATYDIGKSGATRPRDLFLSRNAVIGGTLGVTGVATFTAAPIFSAGFGAALSETTTVDLATASSGSHKLSGQITFDDTQSATAANTTETALFTYQAPANALGVNGAGIRVVAVGTFAANTNNKTVRIRVGGVAGTAVITSPVPATMQADQTSWRIEAILTRIGSNSQRYAGTSWKLDTGDGLASMFEAHGTAALTDNATIDFVVTGQNGSASASDIVFDAAWVEFYN